MSPLTSINKIFPQQTNKIRIMNIKKKNFCVILTFYDESTVAVGLAVGVAGDHAVVAGVL